MVTYLVRQNRRFGYKIDQNFQIEAKDMCVDLVMSTLHLCVELSSDHVVNWMPTL